jgi:hypothetical protein
MFGSVCDRVDRVELETGKATMSSQIQDMQRLSFKTLCKEKEFWLLVVLGILYFYRPLFLKETFFFRDLYLYFLPQKRLLVDFLHHWELPLWDPYLHGGQPYLADLNQSALYPGNLLFLFFPLFRAFNLTIVLHVILSAVSAYLCARVVGLRPISSYIAGMFFGFCGYTLSLINLWGRLLAFPYIPLLILSWHSYLLQGKKKWFTSTVVFGAIQALTGAPETSALSLIFLLGWTLFYPYPHRSYVRKIGFWVICTVFIVGLTSIQLFPTIEMTLQSNRGQGFSYENFTQQSLFFKRLPELIVPGFLGPIDTLRETDYWGWTLVNMQFPYILSIYCGCAAIALAVIGGVHKCYLHPLSSKVRAGLLGGCICALVLSLGRSLPVFRVFYAVPFMSMFRYPIKFLLAGILPLSLLAGYTVDLHFGEAMQTQAKQWVPSVRMVTVFWGIFILFAVLTGTFWLSDTFAEWLQIAFFTHTGGDVAHHGLRMVFAHTTGIWLSLTLLYQYRRLTRNSWQAWLLASIVTLDLLSSGNGVNPTVPESFLTNIPTSVDLVRTHLGEGRLYRASGPPHVILRSPSDKLIWIYRWNLEVLNDFLGAFYQLPVIFHDDFDRMAQADVITLKTLIDSLPWQQRLPILSAGAVTLMITSDELTIPGVHRIAEIPNQSKTPFYLYQNETTAGRVAFITRWQQVASNPEALQAMLASTYDPRQQVILQQPQRNLFERLSRMPEVQEHDSETLECHDQAQINTRIAKTDSAVFTVSNPCQGYLVFAEPFYPGWRIYVDGKLMPIWRANYAFSAVFLPPGDHEVKRAYRPMSLVLGVICSVVFMIGLGAFSLKQDQRL